MEKDLKDIVCIYTTCSNKEEATSLGISAIKEKLAISIDYWAINSIYPWRGEIKETNQYIVMFSTQKMLSNDLIKYIELKHSYEIPVIASFNSSMANKQYNFWADNVLTNKEDYLTVSEIKIREKIKERDLGRLK